MSILVTKTCLRAGNGEAVTGEGKNRRKSLRLLVYLFIIESIYIALLRFHYTIETKLQSHCLC